MCYRNQHIPSRLLIGLLSVHTCFMFHSSLLIEFKGSACSLPRYCLLHTCLILPSHFSWYWCSNFFFYPCVLLFLSLFLTLILSLLDCYLIFHNDFDLHSSADNCLPYVFVKNLNLHFAYLPVCKIHCTLCEQIEDLLKIVQNVLIKVLLVGLELR